MIFHVLLLVSCLFDLLTTQYLLEHQLAVEANPLALVGFGEMAMTSIAIYAVCSVVFYVSQRAVRQLDEPAAESRTLRGLTRAINRRPVVGAAVGLVPLPLVVLIAKLLAGSDNLLLIALDKNVAGALRQQFVDLTTAEFFALYMAVEGTILYALICLWLFRRWQRTGSFVDVRASA